MNEDTSEDRREDNRQDPLAFLDATEQAGLVRRGEVSPSELVEAALARIEKLNPELNAVIRPMDEIARAAARSPVADENAPFPGVPFLLKDLVAEYAGVAISEGSRFLDGQGASTEDSELVVRLKAAGLIIAGKTNTPEFGLLPTTEPALHGPSCNPWDTSRTTGGSSGGSAAAVAAGIVAMAHANDGGGSIRIPAACCGLFGLKPTRARNPLGPGYGDAGSGLAVEHAVTRSVRDSARLLDATSGPDLGDPYWAPPPERPFADEVGRDPGALRIAISTKALTGAAIDPECRRAVEDTAKLCEDLGHHVEWAEPQFDETRYLKAFGAAWTGFAAWAIRLWAERYGLEPQEELFEPNTWQMYLSGERRSSGAYLGAIQDIQSTARQVAGFFKTYDLTLTPTLAQPPVPLGYFAWDGGKRDEFLSHLGEFSGFTSLANGTGQPAMSVPLHWTPDNLPVGVHFMARFGAEGTLFRLAGQLEQARPWAHRRPPVAA
ncbi:MAG: amidase [Rhodospirillaceae bacterium]|nr:amidase [Rhodospirillaceae bacterium]